jgi:hypothetical protein
MTFSKPYTSRYKGRGRPHTRDYKTLHDRHLDALPALMIFVASLGLGIYSYSKNPRNLFADQIELVSPLVREVQAQEVTVIEPTPTPEPEPTTEWEAFVQAATKVSKIYNYPANVVIAQGALESARGNSNFCKTRHNCLGIGAYDSDPNQAYVFENYEQSVVEYMRIIRKNFPEAWAQRENPEALLKALKVNSNGKMYATDEKYVEKVMSMREWSN